MGRAVLLGLFVWMWVGPAWGEVAVVRSTTKVLKTGGTSGGADSAVLEAARNEYEGFQVVLRSEGEAITDVTVEMSDLVGPAGSVIPSANATLYLENYVHIAQPSACFEVLCPDCYKYPEYLRNVGEYPEQLIPFHDPWSADHLAVAVPFDVPPGDLQTVFVDLFVPADAAPGVYQGEAVVRAGGQALRTLDVNLTVWDFAIPTTRNVGTAYGFSRNLIKHYHGGAAGPDDETYERLLDNYEQEVHRHRMDFTTYNPGQVFEFDDEGALVPPDFTAWDAYVGPRIEGDHFPDGAGVNRFNLGMFRPGHGTMGMTDDQYALAAKSMAEHLVDKGWMDNVYLYSSDEPWLPNHAGAMDAIKESVGLLNRYTDLWKGAVLVTGPWMEFLDGLVDIWCPVTPMYGDCLWPEGSWHGPEKYQELMALGQELWFYVCNANYPPTMGYDTDSPIGWEPRLLKWGAWAEGATGFLYWRINYWQSPDPWNVLANFAHFGEMLARHGDGILLYPGDHDGTKGGSGSPDGVSLDGPVVSYRMKQVRDGLEDWEMLILADGLGAGDWAREQVGRVYRKFGEPLNDEFDIGDPPWTLDEGALFDARRMIALKIQHQLKPDIHSDPEAPPVPDPGAEPTSESPPEAGPDHGLVPDVPVPLTDVQTGEPGGQGSGGDCRAGGHSMPAGIGVVLLLSLLMIGRSRRFVNA